ncbi:MAG: DUF4411 family protein [Candidatus Electrothrix sp. ATG2]|nr:DUF4411 family protein [Candidatus Electrothrix sp. ATG2]
MDYCLDSNVFIQTKNAHYHFSICPGFWDWLVLRAGTVGSISPVLEELQNGNDELKDWAKEIKHSHFFADVTEPAVQKIFGSIASYAVDNYKPHVADEFLSGADPWLIAFAKVHGCTAVTHEAYNPQTKRKILIPNVCHEFEVDYTDCFTMLRSLDVRFVLEESRNGQ